MMRAALMAGLLVAASVPAMAAPAYQRPASIPHPQNNPYTAEKLALGRQLFSDTRLSAEQTLSCASCHDPALGFSDGKALGQGEAGMPLARHTPGLWNLAFGDAFYWDGRAPSLERQAEGPITHPLEMNLPLAELTARLKADPDMRLAFAESFPENPRADAANAIAAIATYVRSLVSAPNRVDAWAAGETDALTQSEQAGAAVFYGKAGCASCHSGFAFTDHAFHDIGLGGEDQGRGPVIGMAALNHAFKTPGLRAITQSAPYMHDGSLDSLEAVVAHYESATARGLASFTLEDGERGDLLAFLKAVGEGGAEPAVLPAASEVDALPPAVATVKVSQINLQFAPHHIEVRKGDTITIVNDDKVDHTIRMRDGGVDVSSGLEAPGQLTQITLPQEGRFRAFCGIHPQMELVVTVKP